MLDSLRCVTCMADIGPSVMKAATMMQKAQQQVDGGLVGYATAAQRACFQLLPSEDEPLFAYRNACDLHNPGLQGCFVRIRVQPKSDCFAIGALQLLKSALLLAWLSRVCRYSGQVCRPYRSQLCCVLIIIIRVQGFWQRNRSTEKLQSMDMMVECRLNWRCSTGTCDARMYACVRM